MLLLAVSAQKWAVVVEHNMKLFEVAPDFVKGEEAFLMTILQYLESKTKPGEKIPMANIVRLMSNAGYQFNFDILQDMMADKENTGIKDMISNANQDSITIGKKSPADDESLDDNNAEEKTVDQMASRASQATAAPQF